MGVSSPASRFAIYLVAGYSLGDIDSNVRFREFVMVSAVIETAGGCQQRVVDNVCALLHLAWSLRYTVLAPSPSLELVFPIVAEVA
jgi:hypothetical protein